MTDYYEFDPDDPDAPVELQEYHGLRPGMRVLYQNPAWLQPDGTYKTGGMDPPLVIDAIIRMRSEGDLTSAGMDHVTAILNNGEWEVNADNLVPEI